MATKVTESIKYAGVDDGFFSIKVVDEEGNCFSIPSCASHDVVIGDMGNESDKSFIFETNGRKYTVDESVPSPLDTRNLAQPYPLSDLNRVLVHAGLLCARFAGENVQVTTGLPVRDYYLPTTLRNEDLINKKIENLKGEVACGINNELPIATIVKSSVCSEGIAAYIDLLIDIKGKPTAEAESLKNDLTAIVDIGGHTTDVAVLLPKMKIDIRRSGSASVGVLSLYDELQRVLAAKFNTNPGNITKRQIEMAITCEKVLISRQEVDVSEIVTAQKSALFERIVMAVNQILGNDEDIEHLVIVGGGAIVFDKNLKDRYKGCIIPENPEFSNARGMMKLAKYLQ
ncbi:ParM/StbA family protein [Acerihabitans sp. TG2]|uniref:ParM/StbA family protein n=1 Tax=Acerihabitans sp. TG2 TaxID=3096008 RepID=UPI002B222FDB|nr:ParM/StbA family protein [Acerihabitans sp. TG2]MEA9392133.1 ParM/StbA family protein [Acerihabitans sp. TG2]